MKKFLKVLVLLTVTILISVNANAQVAEQDSLALVALYNSTDGDNWTSHTNWLTSNPVSTWEGITVESGRVTEINLKKYNLVGTIPSEIGDLTALVTLILEKNKLSGTIPATIGNMTSLAKLRIQNNQLTGSIPVEIGNMNNLYYLALYNNQLSGTIPEQIANAPKLKYLYLHKNNLSGDFPATLSNHPALYYVWIYNNEISGLPDLSGAENLSKLKVENNKLTFEDLEANVQIQDLSELTYSPQDSVGKAIDTTLSVGNSYSMSVTVGGSANIYQWKKDGIAIPGANSSVYEISSVFPADSGVYICDVTNSIVDSLTISSRPIQIHVKPVSAITMDSLALVTIYNSTDGANWSNNTNWLTDNPVSTWYGVKVRDGRVAFLDIHNNNLVGTIPKEIGYLTALDTLDMEKNSGLTGPIPSEIGNLTNLQRLKIKKTSVSGSIPPEIGNLTKLKYLGLSDNQLTGSIPATFGNLTELTTLYCSGNQLTGPIPAEIGNMTSLVSLFFSRNQLSGSIPSEIGNLTDMAYMGFNQNELEGPIPEEITNLKKLQRLWLNSNHLSGAVPDSFATLKDLTLLQLQDNELTDLPDLTALTLLATFNVENNKLTFEDLEPNAGMSMGYIPQDSVGEAVDTLIYVGDLYKLSVDVGGTANIYRWKKNGVVIEGADSSVYEIPSAAIADTGSYICEVTNSKVLGLTIYSRPFNVKVKVVDAIDDNKNSLIPDNFALSQNYPNPFNPSTIIGYALPEAAKVRIEVYNVLGQKIALLLDEQKAAGYHTVKFNASSIPAGLYFYKINAGNFRQVKKMLLVK